LEADPSGQAENCISYSINRTSKKCLFALTDYARKKNISSLESRVSFTRFYWTSTSTLRSSACVCFCKAQNGKTTFHDPLNMHFIGYIALSSIWVIKKYHYTLFDVCMTIMVLAKPMT
jgi:hypothetical protein